MNTRRKFLKNGSLATTAFLLAKPFKNLAGITGGFPGDQNSARNISVLYTADLHGRVGSFNLGNLNNIGGLNNIRSTIEENSSSSLLVDAGDFLHERGDFQDHNRMISIMNKTGYHAATLGDKELSNGEDHLASLVPLIDFKLVNCNYEFSNPVLRNKILPFHIARFSGYKIGLTGVGPEVEGISYHNPYEKANEVAMYLKNKVNCDFVICLSHLGLKQEDQRPDNKKFAASSKNIDVIIGGHNNAIVHPQMVLRNSQKSQVIIGNAAYGGSILGRLNFTYNEQRQMHLFACKNFIPGVSSGSSFYLEYKKLCA